MNNYTTVTELPGGGATAEQLSMAVTRYTLAASLAENKSILELASGPGIGLGILAQKARTVVGTDIDPIQIKMGNEYFNGKFELIEASADKVPFPDASFDVIILLEAIYYIKDIDAFFDEVSRLLKKDGKLLISYPNNEWSNFNPSPYTHKYFSIGEMHKLMHEKGFTAKSKLGFLYRTDTTKAKIIDFIRKIAVKLNLIPKSFAVKDLLKRLFLGELTPIPSELKESDGEIYAIEDFENHQSDYKNYRVVYTIGTLK